MNILTPNKNSETNMHNYSNAEKFAKLAEGIAQELPGATIATIEFAPEIERVLANITTYTKYDTMGYNVPIMYRLEWDDCSNIWICACLTPLKEYLEQRKAVRLAEETRRIEAAARP